MKLPVGFFPPGPRRAVGAALLTAALLGIVVAGCGGSSSSSSGSTGESTGGGGSSETQESVSISVLVPIEANNYVKAYLSGIEKQAQKENASVSVQDALFEPQKQVKQCEDSVSAKTADALIIQPVVGTAVVPCVEQAISAEIPVVAVESPIGPSYETSESQVEGLSGSVVGSTEFEAPASALAIEEACKGKNPCQVGRLIAVAGFSFDAARTKVIKEELAKEPNIEVVGEAVYGFEPRQGEIKTRELLTAHPEIEVIESDGEQGLLGLAKINKDLGTEAIGIGNGGATEGVEMIEEGVQFSTLKRYPIQEGEKAAEIAIKSVRGEKVSNPFVDAFGFFGSEEPKGLIVTKENVSSYKPQYSVL